MDWLQDIKVVIFDLDGTLYQDEQFHKRYLAYLLEGTQYQEQLDSLIEQIDNILYTDYAVKIGCFYSFQHDHFLQVEQGQVQRAYTWEGAEIGAAECTALYKNTGFVLNQCLYIGDTWSIVTLISRRLNIANEQLKHAFVRVREEMLSEPFAIRTHQNLLQAVANLTSLHKKILITNTPAPSGIQFVNYLGLDQAFDQIIYDGNKPDGIKIIIQSLLEQQNLKPAEILSIGDNAWNDLHPVRAIGGRTVWISPYDSADSECWDVSLSTLDELSHFFKRLAGATRIASTSEITPFV